jgi:hypothetical protein
MTVLSPTNLETTDYGQQGWNAVHSSNMQRLNTLLTRLWSPLTAPQPLGSITLADAQAATAQVLTNNTGGTASQSLSAVSYANWEDGTLYGIINANMASLADEVNKLRADNEQLRTTVNALLAALRKTNGCGVLNG